VPYIVVKSNGQEVARRELDCGLVIGRAPDCDMAVRDILLSRRHVRIQPSDDGWMVQDLQSKNGTVLNGERLRSPKVLRDNDVVRFGRSKIIFHAGLPDEDFADHVLAPARPATPGDSLAGTLSGFTLLLPGEGEVTQDMPCPQPRAKDPPAYDKEELQTLLTAIASSSWDSVYAEARQPLRGGQGFELDEDVRERRRVRPSSPTDLSLQASPVTNAPISVPAGTQHGWRSGFQPSLHAAVAGVWVCLLILLNMSHKPAASGSAAGNATLATPANLYRIDDSDSNAIVDGQPLKAADQEASDAPQISNPARQPIHFNAQAAKDAAATAALYSQFIW
jgi:predicted component of type VI protein secretion system